MWHVLVFPITGPVKGFVLPDAVQEMVKSLPDNERKSALRVSRDESEGYMLLEGDWSHESVPGAEIFGPLETPEAAMASIEERAKRWIEARGGTQQ